MLWAYLLIVVPVLSIVSGFLYWFDKRQAIQQGSRIPEATLLSIDLFGGWPGGWWSQQKFRHKTQKKSFRIRFFVSILGNILLVCVLLTVSSRFNLF